MRQSSVRAMVIVAGMAFGVAAFGQQTVTWTGAAGNNLYSDPANWNPSLVPLSGAFDVVIPAGATVRVDASVGGAVSVLSIDLDPASDLLITGGATIDVTDDAGLRGDVTVSSGGRLTAAGGSTITGATFRAQSGGVVETGSITYDTGDRNLSTLLSASGAGSLFDGRSLRTFIYGVDGRFESYQVSASGGGRIDLSGLTTLRREDTGANDQLSIGASSAGSEVLLSSLTTLEGGSISVTSSGGARIDLSGLANLGGQSQLSFSASDGEIDLRSLATLGASTDVTLSVSSGGVLRLDSLTSLGSGNTRDLTASGTGGSVLDLSGLTDLGGGNTRRITASGDGRIDLSGLTSIGGGTGHTFIANGDGVIDISALPTLRDVAVTVSGAGQFLAGQVTDFNGTTLSATSGGVLALPSATSYDTGERNLSTIFNASGAGSRLDLSTLTSITYGVDGRFESYTISAGNGGVLDLSGVSAITRDDAGSNDQFSISASGAGSEIRLGGLAAFAAGSVFVTASSGSSVDLSAVTDIGTQGGMSFSGSGGTIDLRSLATLGAADNVSISASSGGTVNLAALTSLGGGDTRDLGASGTGGSVLDLSGLTDLGGGNTRRITASGDGRVDLSGLTSIGGGTGHTFNASGSGVIDLSSLPALRDVAVTVSGSGQFLAGQVTDLTGTALSATSGGLLALPSATSYDTGERNLSTFFSASGAGSRLDLTSLTSFTYGADGRFESYTISANNGGVLDLSGVSTITRDDAGNNDQFSISASGAGSQIRLGGLTAYNGGDLFVTAGSDAVVDLSGIASFGSAENLNFTGSSGGTVNLAGLTDLGSGNIRDFNVNGTGGSVMDLSGLTDLGGGDTRRFTATGDGRIDLSGLTSIGGGTGHTFTANGDGVIDVSGLAVLRDVSVTVGGSGQFLAGLVSDFTGTRLTVNSGGRLSLPSATSYDTGERNLSTIFNASGDGSVLDLATLTSLTYGADDRFESYTINAGSGGTVDLRGVSTITRDDPGGNDQLSLSASGAGSQIRLGGLTAYNGGDLFVTSGSDAVVDLSGIASFGSAENLNFTGSSGGTVNLAGLTDLGSGNIRDFNVNGTGGSVMDLSGLTDLGGGDTRRFTATGDGRINLSGLTSIGGGTGHTFTANGDGVIDVSALPTLRDVSVTVGGSGQFLAGLVSDFTGTRLTVNSGGMLALSSATSYDTGDRNLSTLFSATGGGSVLDLATLTSLTYGTDGRFESYTISANSGGVVDLSGVSTITRDDPGNSDQLSINANGVGSRMLLGGFGDAAGRVSVSATNGGEFLVGPMVIDDLGDVTVNTGGILDVRGDLVLGRDGSIFSDGTGSITIRGSYVSSRAVESQHRLEASTLTFVSDTADAVRRYEAAGENLGTSALPTDANGNFGLGRLVIGGNGNAFTLRLTDLINNGNRGPGSEVLYLFGVGGLDGLAIADGATFDIGDLSVFASIGGGLVNLRTLFRDGETQVAFDGGFIVIPTPATLVLAGVAGLAAVRRRRA